MDTSNLKELFVVGRLRSGTVWLNLLLCDALNSPLEAIGDMAEPARYFGPGRAGGYIIRKSHDEIKRGPTVFIQRDPRDVVVSLMYFSRQTNLFDVINQICYPRELSYEVHIRKWLDDRTRAEFYTTYELLHQYPILELSLIIFALTGKVIEDEELAPVVSRQSFDSVKANDKEGRVAHSMHKGIVGNWKNYFTREIGEYMQQEMGDFMLEQDYIQDENWWKELSDDF